VLLLLLLLFWETISPGGEYLKILVILGPMLILYYCLRCHVRCWLFSYKSSKPHRIMCGRSHTDRIMCGRSHTDGIVCGRSHTDWIMCGRSHTDGIMCGRDWPLHRHQCMLGMCRRMLQDDSLGMSLVPYSLAVCSLSWFVVCFLFFKFFFASQRLIPWQKWT
jgi:hypothetical protein